MRLKWESSELFFGGAVGVRGVVVMNKKDATCSLYHLSLITNVVTVAGFDMYNCCVHSGSCLCFQILSPITYVGVIENSL